MTVMTYDMIISGIDRKEHIPCWLLSASSSCVGAFRNGICVGYGALRKFGEMYKVQPLFADNMDIAIAILHHLFKTDLVQGSKVRFYPAVQNEASALTLTKFFSISDVEPVSDYRMHTTKDITFQWQKVYSSTNTTNTII